MEKTPKQKQRSNNQWTGPFNPVFAISFFAILLIGSIYYKSFTTSQPSHLENNRSHKPIAKDDHINVLNQAIEEQSAHIAQLKKLLNEKDLKLKEVESLLKQTKDQSVALASSSPHKTIELPPIEELSHAEVAKIIESHPALTKPQQDELILFLKKLEAKYNQANRQIDDLKKNIASLNEKIAERRQQETFLERLLQNDTSKSEATRLLTLELNKSKRKLREQEESLDLAEAKITKLTQKIETLKDEKKILFSEKNALAKELDHLLHIQTNYRKLQKSLDAKNALLVEMAAALKEQKEALEQLTLSKKDLKKASSFASYIPKSVDQKEEQHNRISTYTVQKGDTLMSISMKHYGTTKRWHEIFEANKDVIKDKNQIKAGMSLHIPN